MDAIHLLLTLEKYPEFKSDFRVNELGGQRAGRTGHGRHRVVRGLRYVSQDRRVGPPFHIRCGLLLGWLPFFVPRDNPRIAL